MTCPTLLRLSHSPRDTILRLGSLKQIAASESPSHERKNNALPSCFQNIRTSQWNRAANHGSLGGRINRCNPIITNVLLTKWSAAESNRIDLDTYCPERIHFTDFAPELHVTRSQCAFLPPTHKAPQKLPVLEGYRPAFRPVVEIHARRRPIAGCPEPLGRSKRTQTCTRVAGHPLRCCEEVFPATP